MNKTFLDLIDYSDSDYSTITSETVIIPSDEINRISLDEVTETPSDMYADYKYLIVVNLKGIWYEYTKPYKSKESAMKEFKRILDVLKR